MGLGAPIRVCFPFVGDTLGGSHLSTLLLLRHFDKARYEPLVVLDEKGPLATMLEQENVEYAMLPIKRFRGWKQGGKWRQLYVAAATAFARARFLRRHGISIVHTNDMRMHLAWAGSAKLAGAGFVWHQRAIFPRSRICSLAARLADRIVANSRFTATTFQSPNIEKKVRVVHNPFEDASNGLSASDAKSKLLSELGRTEGSWVIGFFANLLENKRPLIFSQAAAQILKSIGPNVVFPIFGAERDQQARLLKKKLNALGLENHIHFMGFRHPIESWMAACDVILVPAVGDSFGRTLVEAMMIGTPVVASASGGHLEIIENGHNGILVPPDDPGAFADAAITLIRSPDRHRELAERAREHARKHYGAARHAEEIAKLYDEIVALRGLKRPNDHAL